MQRGVEIMPEGAAQVGKRIQANAVEVGGFDPPHRILDQVARDKRILLVQVRHSVGKSALGDGLPVAARSMRVHKLIEIVLRLEMILDRAKVLVHCVEMGGRVAVTELGHVAVGGHRRGPERIDAELLQLVQMLLDAGEVPAMPSALGCAIAAGLLGGLITLGEAVGHDQVKRISR